LKSFTNLTAEDVKQIISAFNKRNRTHITSKDIFDIIDFIVKQEESVGLECKFLINKAEQDRLPLKDFVLSRFGFDPKTPMISKTIFFGKCRDMFPDSCTK